MITEEKFQEALTIINKYSKQLRSSDTKMSKTELLERLYIEFNLKYHQCPEGEQQENYHKRVFQGEGFLNAMKIVADFHYK